MSWRKSRQIVERIVIEGTLTLLTPTSLSNGDADGLTDISLIKDEVSEKALLTGTSICGALRNYLREVENGFENPNESDIAEKLFGWTNDQDGSQSLLIIDDAISSEKPKTELRDGVKIDRKTRTAADKAKFDLELLETGTEFPLRFELLICEQRKNKEESKEQVELNTREFKSKLVSTLATALKGFEDREIYLGGRKRRGYGECEVPNWRVKNYDVKDKNGLLDWLRNNDKPLNGTNEQPILIALGVQSNSDSRNYFELDGNFVIDGSVLIRSGSKLPNVSDKSQPDTVHLRSNDKPIISGTSLAGVLRHRAFKIINTLSNEVKAKDFTEKIFGVDMEELKLRNKELKKNGQKLETPFSSRLEVKETEIKNTHDLVQTRVKIDRFTGGAMEGALFDAAPVFSDGEQQSVNIKLRLRNAKPCEIGLLLLLLKDLWTSDLPIGGESSIGRGRLKGKSACLSYKNGTGSWHASLDRIDDSKVKIDGIEDNSEKIELLNEFVEDFNEKLKEQNDESKN